MTLQESPEGRLSQTLQEKHIKKLLHSRDTGEAPACSVFKVAVFKVSGFSWLGFVGVLFHQICVSLGLGKGAFL